MPSKALLASSDALYDARESGALGIHVAGTSADMPFIARRKRELVKEFAEYRVDGIEKFPVYCGRAAFLSEREVQVGDDVVLEGRRFIIATGSVPAPPVLPGLAKAGYLDSDAILDLERIPNPWWSSAAATRPANSDSSSRAWAQKRRSSSAAIIC